MSAPFRIALRLKSIKPHYRPMPDTRPLSEILKGLPLTPLPTIRLTEKCLRCGMHRGAGPMSYCCPEGHMCGVPRGQGPSFYPYIATTIGSGSIVTPHDPSLILRN